MDVDEDSQGIITLPKNEDVIMEIESKKQELPRCDSPAMRAILKSVAETDDTQSMLLRQLASGANCLEMSSIGSKLYRDGRHPGANCPDQAGCQLSRVPNV